MKDRMTEQPVNAADRRVVHVVVAGLVLACMVIGVLLLLLRSDDSQSTPAPRGAAVGPARDRAEEPTTPFRAWFTDVAAEAGVRHSISGVTVAPIDVTLITEKPSLPDDDREGFQDAVGYAALALGAVGCALGAAALAIACAASRKMSPISNTRAAVEFGAPPESAV